MQSNGGVHVAVATAKLSSWMSLMQTNGGVHMGSDTVAVAATQCERICGERDVLMSFVILEQGWSK